MAQRFEIVAHHLGFGMVAFIIEADDDKKAFTKWKQVVFNPRQWIVKSNVAVGTTVTKETSAITAGQRLPDVEEL